MKTRKKTKGRAIDPNPKNSKYGFPPAARVTESVGWYLFDADKREDCQRAYVAKFQDLIEWSHIETDGLARMLRVVSESGDIRGVQALNSLADHSIRDLEILASKADARAITALLSIAMSSTSAIARLAERQTEVCACLAQCSENWPVLLPRPKASREKLEKFVLGRLMLAEKVPLNLTSRKSFSPESAENQIAIELLIRVRTLREAACSGALAIKAKRLENFTKRTVGEWWKIADEVLEALHPEFEKFPAFQRYFKNRALKEKGTVRTAIKKQIKQAFETIAPMG